MCRRRTGVGWCCTNPINQHPDSQSRQPDNRTNGTDMGESGATVDRTDSPLCNRGCPIHLTSLTPSTAFRTLVEFNTLPRFLDPVGPAPPGGRFGFPTCGH